MPTEVLGHPLQIPLFVEYRDVLLPIHHHALRISAKNLNRVEINKVLLLKRDRLDHRTAGWKIMLALLALVSQEEKREVIYIYF